MVITQKKRKAMLDFILDKQTRWGCLYILRKNVLECLSPPTLKAIMNANCEAINLTDCTEPLKLISMIEDFVLDQKTTSDIKKWIRQNISEEDLTKIYKIYKEND